MNFRLPILSLAAGLLASAAYGQFPDLPANTFDGMPKNVACQIRKDMARVNAELADMMNGRPLPLLPLAPATPADGGFALPPLDAPAAGGKSFSSREAMSYSMVNGNFTLRHQVNGVGYRRTGCMKAGAPVVKQIAVQNDDGLSTYADVTMLPRCHQKAVANLLRNLTDE